jgi:cytochrome c-type biogenesis protein CcmH/NrfG
MRNTKRILSKLLLLVLVVGLGGGCTRTARRNRAIAAGDKYFAAEDYDKAEASYLQAARMMAPPSEVALRQLGLLYMAEGRPTPTAVWCLQQASKAEPDNVKILIELAAALQQDAHLAEAKELAYRILKLQPYHERALVILCETARSTEEAEQTRQYIEKLRQQDKERGVYHLAFGYIDANEGNYAWIRIWRCCRSPSPRWMSPPGTPKPRSRS